MTRKSTRLRSYELKGYGSTVLSFIVVVVLVILLVVSLVVLPGFISSWRSGRLNDRGVEWCAGGNLGAGKDAFLKAVSLDPENVTARYNLALVVLVADDDPGTAAEHFNETVRLKPDYARAYHNLGVIELFYQRKTALALDHLRVAAALDPGYAPTHLSLGYLYEYTGEYGKAREEFALCVAGDPTGPWATEAKAHRRAIAGAPLVDDLAEKLSYCEIVYEIVAVGNLYLDKPLKEAGRSNAPLRFIAPVLDNALFTVGNLGAPLTERTRPVRLKGPKVPAGDPNRTYIFSDGSFDAVTLISDEIVGFGPGGLEDTLRYLEDEEVEHAGAGPDLAAAVEPAKGKVEGVSGCVLGVNGRKSVDIIAGPGKPGCAPLDPRTVLPAVSRAASDADIVVVMVRWGKPAPGVRPGETTALAHAMVDAGADLVVGTGSVMILPVETYNDGVIAYGLPDLLPSPSRRARSYPHLLAVEYSPEIGVIGYRLVPAYVENVPLTLTDDDVGSLLDSRLVKSVP